MKKSLRYYDDVSYEKGNRMKKIGILYGMEHSFPLELAETINKRKVRGIVAESMKIGSIRLDSKIDCDVILDRVSYEVPYFRSVLKKAAFDAIRVINHPFYCCAADNFYNLLLAKSMGINVPKTAILPSKEHPEGASSESMKNLIYPLNWEETFDYIGFPAYIKPNQGLSGSNAYKVYNHYEFFAAFDFTGSKVMMLQEAIEYMEFYRVFVIGKKEVRIISYDPGKPHNYRYSSKPPELSPELKNILENDGIKMAEATSFDFNAIDFAIRDGVPYAIELLNPVPRIDKEFMRDEDYSWILETSADLLINAAKEKNFTDKTKAEKIKINYWSS